MKSPPASAEEAQVRVGSKNSQKSALWVFLYGKLCSELTLQNFHQRQRQKRHRHMLLVKILKSQL